MSTEIATFDTMERMAQSMVKSKLFGVKTLDEALGLMMVAQAEGQHPATIVQDYDIIQGRAARKTHSVLARFQQAGGRVEWHELSDTKAEATFSHPQGIARIAWTIDQAKRIGLTSKDNWKNYPRAMLRARCIAEGVRAAFPAAIGGMLVTEEAQDIESRDMGPAVVVREAAKEVLSPERFEKALAAVNAGQFSREKLLSDYALTEEQIARVSEPPVAEVAE